MAIDKIKVNTNKLHKTTGDIEDALKDIKNKIDAMKADVSSLNSMWTGDANAEFNKAFQDDIKDLGIICDNIQSVIDYEKKAKIEYDKCEQRVSELVDEITV
ncbi:MAG: WXG100 family type VII secretion target [Lachnospiraceae bacterium]|nr:WXG100 family type VII secretion target [Lachnospiraceae bacterium]